MSGVAQETQPVPQPPKSNPVVCTGLEEVWWILVVAAASVAALQWRTLVLFFQTWQSRTYSHAFFVLPISIFIIWTRRHEIEQVPVRPSRLGIVLASISGLASVLGAAGDVHLIQELGFVGLLAGTAWAVLGAKATRRLAFPLAFLIFLVPFGDSLISPLQDFTASFAVNALHLTGVPALLEGRIITLPTGDWQVAEACSGIHYLISMTVLGCLLAVMWYRSWNRKLLLLAFSILFPIVANGIRAYLILLLAYESGNRLAVGVDHIIYGWVLFCLMAFVLFTVAAKWREDHIVPISKPSAGPRGLVVPLPAFGKTAALCVLIALVAVVPEAVWARRPAIEMSTPTLPAVSGPWSSGPLETSLTLSIRDPHTDIGASYSFPFRGAVEVIMRSYSLANSGMPIASSADPSIEGGDPTTWRAMSRIVRLNGRDQAVIESMIVLGPRRWVAYTWYTVDGRAVNSSYQVKLLQAKVRLLGGIRTAERIVVAAPVRTTLEEAEPLLDQFVSSAQFSNPQQ